MICVAPAGAPIIGAPSGTCTGSNFPPFFGALFLLGLKLGQKVQFKRETETVLSLFLFISDKPQDGGFAEIFTFSWRWPFRMKNSRGSEQFFGKYSLFSLTFVLIFALNFRLKTSKNFPEFWRTVEFLFWGA